MCDIEVREHFEALDATGCTKQDLLIQLEVIHKGHLICYPLNLDQVCRLPVQASHLLHQPIT